MEPNESQFEGIRNNRYCVRNYRIHFLIEKYFPLIDRIACEYQPESIDEHELRRLLNDHNLNDYYEFFFDIAMWLSKIIEFGTKQDAIIENERKRFNESIDLIHLAEELKKGTFTWVELKPAKCRKIKISTNEILQEIGAIILNHYDHKLYYKDHKLINKRMKSRGKPRTKYDLAAICFKLLLILNNETDLKYEGEIISNDQEEFILELLEIAKVLKDDQSYGYDQNYIRTLLNNYKGSDPKLKIVM